MPLRNPRKWIVASEHEMGDRTRTRQQHEFMFYRYRSELIATVNTGSCMSLFSKNQERCESRTLEPQAALSGRDTVNQLCIVLYTYVIGNYMRMLHVIYPYWRAHTCQLIISYYRYYDIRHT
ncbi:uncharacterized protein LOC125500594 [Athalia rosae]|uniref:uncharacterized protein LOC125500594 n=1 Tax=Athalia rosae TaxID=37344 RepID=UPI002033EA81|nr:uncharacterized protein LOC125500594 [Athalia rosae]